MESRERVLGLLLSTDKTVGLRSHPLPSHFLPGSGMTGFLLHAGPGSAVCQLHGKPEILEGVSLMKPAPDTSLSREGTISVTF